MVPLIGITCSEAETSFELGHQYVKAIEQAGGAAVGIPPHAAEDRLERMLDRLDGLLVSGGTDVDPRYYGEEILRENGSIQPGRDRAELALTRQALKLHIPFLGICRGMQVLNVAAGGTLYQDIPSQTNTRLQHRQKAPRHYGTHQVTIAENSLLGHIVGRPAIDVNSYHHQAVKQVAPGFRVVAEASDGIAEAIESETLPFALGVQWHPEHMCAEDEVQAGIFRAFVQAIRQRM